MEHNLLHDVQFDADIDLAVALGARATLTVRRVLQHGRVSKRPVGGSRPGRRPNRNRDFDLGAHSSMRDNFGVGGEPPVYSEQDFEKRHRMPRAVFMRLYAAGHDKPWWRRSVSATGRLQSHPIQKLVAALHVLGFEESYDRADEYCRLSRSTIAKAPRRLTRLVVDKWKQTYLRRPTEKELKHILSRNAARGMPGCIGSIDCTHWQWLKCLKTLSRLYHDSKGNGSVVSESVCDEDTYIWHFWNGAPGSYNDKIVLASSPLMLDVNAGIWPPRNIKYTLNGRTRPFLFYAADQGYPRYALYAMPHLKPDTPKLLVYNRLQEAVRKDAKRLYAVMPSRFNIVLRPARVTTVSRMIDTGKSVAVFHNMNIEHTRGGFLAQRRMQDDADLRESVDEMDEDKPRRVASGERARNEATRGQRASPNREAAFYLDDEPRGPGVWGPAVAEKADLGRDSGASTEQDAPVGALGYTDGAECEAKDTSAHWALLQDLSEHICADRGRLLLPYV